MDPNAPGGPRRFAAVALWALGVPACGGTVEASGARGGGGGNAGHGGTTVASSGGRAGSTVSSVGGSASNVGGSSNGAGGAPGSAGGFSNGVGGAPGSAGGFFPSKEGTCASNEARCAVSCVDLSRDPNNCGRCFTVCPGRCMNGVCE